MAVIRKAVIPVAGLGTRFLPATKAQPKEMLTLVDKPIIQYIVEEAVAAGIEQIIFVTSQSKRAIEDHFDRNFELEYRLRKKKKHKELAEICHISDLANFIYVRQKSPLGLGHAIAAAAPLINDEPFAVMLGDDLIDGKKPALQKLIDIYSKYQDSVLATIQVPWKNVSQYGIIKAKKITADCYQIEKLIEKPSREAAPSNLAIIGRYILTPDILEILARTKPGKGGEIQLTDALIEYNKKRAIYAAKIADQRFDCGDKLGFLTATVNYGIKHRDIKKDFKKYLLNISHD